MSFSRLWYRQSYRPLRDIQDKSWSSCCLDIGQVRYFSNTFAAMPYTIRCLYVFALLILSIDSEPIRKGKRHQVVIVGAGVSGFTAAATLLEHNVTDLVVLEAADRIGGRIHTVEFGGAVIDRGAEFCHGEVDNVVYDLVGPHDLLTSYDALTTPEQCLIINTTGHEFNATALRELGGLAFQILYQSDRSHFNGSVAAYFYPRLDQLFEERNVDSYTREALRYLTPLWEGAASGTEDLSVSGAWGQSNYWECEGDYTLKWKNGTRGYKTIFDFLSKKIPNPSEELPVVNKTVLGKQVTRIERKAGEVEVTCADGSTYLADHVIVTVSLGVLKKHAADMFHPALPEDKSAAIETLGFGCVAKVFILFPNRWWPQDINVITPFYSNKEIQDFIRNSNHGSWTSKTYGFYPVVNHDRMLCAWFSGPGCRTVEGLSDEQVTEGLMELLDKLVGKMYNISQPEGILRSDWGTYPYTLGAYNYRTVASDSRNLSNSDLAESILDDHNKPVILFAGEATHPHYFSTVHGAIETGRREAHNILNYMKNKQ
ncbi:hypothetical protein J6590_015491 [Homalodisca vitripennis]|nr:hypothetical protein J6590_015491 [Homalodisca vitripennis]